MEFQEVMQNFNFGGGGPASLLYWEKSAVDNGWSLVVKGHLSDQGEKEELRDQIAGDVGPDLWGYYDWLAGMCAQTYLPYEMTNKTRQSYGHLVMPVFRYEGTQEILVGVIALVTFIPKRSYIDEFNQINNLLMGENLATAMKIKVRYEKDIIAFSLPLKSSIDYLENNVTNRFTTLNQKPFIIMYDGYRDPISTSADLRACLADPIGSVTVTMLIVACK